MIQYTIGQLSGLIIAFTLALNKVYENNSMQVLLIDEPIQTMDEFNKEIFMFLLDKSKNSTLKFTAFKVVF